MMRKMKQLWAAVVGNWSARPSLDWLLVAAVFVGVVVSRVVGWADLDLSDLAKDDRMRVYTAIATVSSLLFGFATASIAFFYGTAKGSRLDLLKKVLGPEIVRTWRAALAAPLLAVAAALCAMTVDTGASGKGWIAWLITGTLAFLGVRAVRLRWMFIQTIRLLSLDLSNPPETVKSATGKTPTPKARPTAKAPTP